MKTFLKKLILLVLIHSGAFVISKAEAQQDSGEDFCIQRVREATRRLYGQCLAERKNQEIKDLKKWYLESLNELRKDYEAKLQRVRAERDQLRKGILPKKGSAVSNRFGDKLRIEEKSTENNILQAKENDSQLTFTLKKSHQDQGAALTEEKVEKEIITQDPNDQMQLPDPLEESL